MATSAIDSRIQFHLYAWYGIVALGALILGICLAASQFLIAFLVAGLGWLVLLPYHARLSILLATATFSSALILPIPGRLTWWEFAALLAWTGVPIVIFLRRYPPDFGRTLRENKWLFVGAALYCVTLLVIMGVRGVGLRILGSGQVGGRFYFQQLLCAIFPLLFIAVRLDEKTFVKLYTMQWLLTGTYLVSDFAFSVAPGQLIQLLNFFELANDAINFEVQSLRFGVRRFQSLAFVGQGLIFLLLIRYNLRDFFGRRAVWLLPLTLTILALSLLSGHRWIITILGTTLLVLAFAQRFLTVRNLLIAATVLLLNVAFIYATVDHLPRAFQRSVSFLPGLRIDNKAAADAAATWWVRKTLFGVGMRLIPEYLLIGRGFERYMDDYSFHWDRTTITFHVIQGKFYNGLIGLLINTGFTGALAMVIFMAAGTRLAWNIIKYLRKYGAADNLERTCGLIASSWVANVLGFLLLHGDSEWAMKTFSMQAGMLLACDYFLAKRVAAAQPEAELPAAAAAA
ncbi:MAG: hypothetical protein FJ387_24050 [Verrucomicrobia bacterium]|nr:hypothetical protein [Verrucomicrobiota bacterium]